MAKFEGPHDVSFQDDFENSGVVKGEKIIVAVGGRPSIPGHNAAILFFRRMLAYVFNCLIPFNARRSASWQGAGNHI